MFITKTGPKNYKAICTVVWLSGNLKGITMDTEVFSPIEGTVRKPYGTSGKYQIIKVH